MIFRGERVRHTSQLRPERGRDVLGQCHQGLGYLYRDLSEGVTRRFSQCLVKERLVDKDAVTVRESTWEPKEERGDGRGTPPV